jgi:hypothetical protein
MNNRAAMKQPWLTDRGQRIAALIPFPVRRRPLPTKIGAKTKRPSWRAHAKLSTLLAIEIETAARRLQECINNGDRTGLEDSLRFIELQISFVKEVNSMVLQG